QVGAEGGGEIRGAGDVDAVERNAEPVGISEGYRGRGRLSDALRSEGESAAVGQDLRIRPLRGTNRKRGLCPQPCREPNTWNESQIASHGLTGPSLPARSKRPGSRMYRRAAADRRRSRSTQTPTALRGGSSGPAQRPGPAALRPPAPPGPKYPNCESLH